MDITCVNQDRRNDLRYLKLDQTTPQDIFGGQPDFLAGLRAGSTNQLSIDASGNVVTSGTLGAGAITGTSLIKSGGTSSQFLKADGSVDSSTYLTKATDKLTRTVTIDYDGDWDSEEIPLMDLSDVACTITAVRSSVLGSSTPTLTFNIEERPWGTDITPAGTVITSSAMTADADGLEQTSFSNAGIAAKAHLVLTTGASAASGTVDALVITIDYTKD
jgi:hypothetical protein